MSRAQPNTPQWFREEAEHCFRLAEKITDQKASDALTSYGRELLAKAERMEATLSGAIHDDAVSESPRGTPWESLPDWGHRGSALGFI